MDIRLTRHIALFVVIACGVATGCTVSESDVSQTSQYKTSIGQRYRTKVPIYALGLTATNGSRTVAKYWLSPHAETGPEVLLRQTIPAGQILRVAAVRKTYVPLENGIEFVVVPVGLDLQPRLDVIMPLYGYFRGVDGFPDPEFFERVEGSKSVGEQK